jgi:hypothetical protein
LRDGGTSVAGYSISAKTSESETPRLAVHKRGYSLNISQETTPLYRLSHDKIFTPGSKRLFKYTKSPNNPSSPETQKTHGRSLSLIVEQNPSPRANDSKRSAGQYLMTPRPPSRELFKFIKIRKEPERTNQSADTQKETFLKRNPFRNLNPDDKSALQPIRVRRELIGFRN